jgi:hypothetical protein
MNELIIANIVPGSVVAVFTNNFETCLFNDQVNDSRIHCQIPTGFSEAVIRVRKVEYLPWEQKVSIKDNTLSPTEFGVYVNQVVDRIYTSEPKQTLFEFVEETWDEVIDLGEKIDPIEFLFRYQQ